MPVTLDCPAYYNAADDLCLTASDVWSRSHLGCAVGDTTLPVVQPGLGQSLAPQASADDLRMRSGLTAALMLEGFAVGRATSTLHGLRVECDEAALPAQAFLQGANGHKAIDSSAFVEHDVVFTTSGGEIAELISAAAFSTDEHAMRTYRSHIEPTLAALLHAVPGLPRLTVWERARFSAWRRLLLWCPPSTLALVQTLNQFAAVAHNPAQATSAVRTKTLRSLDAARAQIDPRTVVECARALLTCHVLLVELESTTHCGRATTALMLDMLATPFLSTAVLYLLNAPPAFLEDADAAIRAEVHRSHSNLSFEERTTPDLRGGSSAAAVATAAAVAAAEDTHTTQLESCLGAVVVPLLRLLCGRLQQWAEHDCDLLPGGLDRDEPLEASAKAAAGALHFLMVRLRSVQARSVAVFSRATHNGNSNDAAADVFVAQQEPGTWPGEDRLLVCGALLRGINATLGAVMPALGALTATSIESVVPTVSEIQQLGGLSARAWMSLVSTSYSLWRAGSHGTGQPYASLASPGLSAADAAKHRFEKDKLTAFSPVAHALRQLMMLDVDAKTQREVFAELLSKPDASYTTAFDLRDVRVLATPPIHAAPLAAALESRGALLSIAHPSSDLAASSIEDAVGAIAIYLGGSWFVVWCRVHRIVGASAFVELLHEDASTVATLVSSVQAMINASEFPEGGEGGAVACFLVEVFSNTTADLRQPSARSEQAEEEGEEQEVDPALCHRGRATQRLMGLLRSCRQHRLLQGDQNRYVPVAVTAAARFPNSWASGDTAVQPVLGIDDAKVAMRRVLASRASLRPPLSLRRDATTFRSASLGAARALPASLLPVGCTLTTQQDETLASALNAASNCGDFGSELWADAHARDASAPVKKDPMVCAAGTHLRLLVGGPGSGKSTVATLLAAATVHGFAAVRTATVAEFVKSAKDAAASLRQHASPGGKIGPALVGAAAACHTAIAALKAGQRASSPVLFMQGGSSGAVAGLETTRAGILGERLTAAASPTAETSSQTFQQATLREVLQKAGLAARRAPIYTTCFGPRLRKCVESATVLRRRLAPSTDAAVDPLPIELWALTALPRGFVSAAVEASTSAEEACTTLEKLFDRHGITQHVLEQWSSATLGEGDDGAAHNDTDGRSELRRLGLVADDELLTAAVLPLPLSATDRVLARTEAALQTARRRVASAPAANDPAAAVWALPLTAEGGGGRAPLVAAEQAAQIAACVVEGALVLQIRAIRALQAEVQRVRLAFADVVAGIAVAQLLGGTYGSCIVAAPSDLDLPYAAAVVDQWRPRLVVVDDGDLAPECMWTHPALSSAQVSASDLRTATGRAAQALLGHRQQFFVTCSSTVPALRQSLWNPANTEALTSCPASASGVLALRPYLTSLCAVVGAASVRAIGSVVFTALTESPSTNRHTQSADVAMASCALAAAGGSLDEAASSEGAAAVAAQHSATHAPGLGGSAFVVTYNDVAPRLKQATDISAAFAAEALREFAVKAVEYCRAVAEAYGGKPLTVRVFECYANGHAVPPFAQLVPSRDATHPSRPVLEPAWTAIDPSAATSDDGSTTDYLVVLVHPSPSQFPGASAVPLGDHAAAGDSRDLSRVCSRARRAVVLAAPTSALEEFPYLAAFAEVTRQILSYRGANWILSSLGGSQLHAPVLPLECPSHSGTHSALLVTLLPRLTKRVSFDGRDTEERSFVSELGGEASSTTDAGITSSAARGCRSICLRRYSDCAVPNHRCLAPCHILSAPSAPSDADATDDDGTGRRRRTAFGPDDEGTHATCPFPCPRRLPCGHRCRGICGAPCDGCGNVVLLQRGCGTTVISGYAEGKPVYSKLPHYAERECTGLAAEFDPNYWETDLGPCQEMGSAICPRCTMLYDGPCAMSAARPFCPACEEAINTQLTVDVSAPFNVLSALFSAAMAAVASTDAASSPPQNGEVYAGEPVEGTTEADAMLGYGDGDGDDDDDGAGFGFIPDPSFLNEKLDELLALEANAAASEALTLHWRKEKMRHGLLAKKVALEVSSKGPDANAKYRVEAARVAESEQRKSELEAAIAAAEKASEAKVAAEMATALKAQAELNADTNVLSRAIADTVMVECQASS
jgi:hypothetical protein